MLHLYQKLFRNTNYAQGKLSPGLRSFKDYKFFLRAPIVDLGCGAGEVVDLLRARKMEADGIDWVVKNPHCYIRDITDEMDLSPYRTALCFDVLEHLELKGIRAVLQNMSVCERQVLSVHNGPSVHLGVELHITKMPFSWWQDLVREYVTIERIEQLDPLRQLYLCKKRY